VTVALTMQCGSGVIWTYNTLHSTMCKLDSCQTQYSSSAVSCHV